MRLTRQLGRIRLAHTHEVVGKRVEEFCLIYEDEDAQAAFSGNCNYRRDGSVTADLELADEKLRLVPFRLIEVRENEKTRLAGKLRDSIEQTLAALMFRIKHVIATLKKRQSKQAAQLLHELIPIPRRSIDETGTVCNGFNTRLRSRKYQVISGGALNSLSPPHPLRLAGPRDLYGALEAFGQPPSISGPRQAHTRPHVAEILRGCGASLK
jgi:hypothetical protein